MEMKGREWGGREENGEERKGRKGRGLTKGILHWGRRKGS